MCTRNCFNESLPKIIFLFICGTMKNCTVPENTSRLQDSHFCFFFLISYSINAHPSTSIESSFTDCSNAVCFFNLGLFFKDLYTFLWISDTSALESNKALNFCMLIFNIQEFRLPASLILNIGISCNVLYPLASTWFEFSSFPKFCLVEYCQNLICPLPFTVSLHVTLLSTLPTFNFTFIQISYLFYCINDSRSSVLGQMSCLATEKTFL